MRWYQAWQLYSQLPMKQKTILPDEGFGPLHVEVGVRITTHGDKEPVRMNVSCKPKGQGRRAPHRVTIKCCCGRDIPFGRMNQHWPKCKEKAW